MQAYLFGYQIHTAGWARGAQDDGDISPVQILQTIEGAGHNLMPGVQQGSINVQENDRIGTHPIAPPPLLFALSLNKYLSI